MTAALEDLPNDVASVACLGSAQIWRPSERSTGRDASELAERDSQLERLMAMLQTCGVPSSAGAPRSSIPPNSPWRWRISRSPSRWPKLRKRSKHRSASRRHGDRPRPSAAPLPAHLSRVEQVLEPDSRLARAVTGRCIRSARTGPSGLTSSRLSIACWSRAGPSTPAAPAKVRSYKPRRRRG